MCTVELVSFGSGCDEARELAFSFAGQRMRKRNMRAKEEEMRVRNMMDVVRVLGGQHRID